MGRSSPRTLRDAPLHTKQVGRVDLAALAALPTPQRGLQQALEAALGYLTNLSLYDAVPRKGADSCPETRLAAKDIKQLVKHGVLVPIQPEEVQGHVQLFTVYEFFKDRRRPIKWPRAINEALGKDTIDPDMNIAGKRQILELVQKGKFFVEFDGASFFDQFELSEDIGCLMCARKGNQFYRCGTAPMGQRQIVQVAQRAMQKVCTIENPRCSLGVTIDNAILVGDTAEDVLADLHQILERAQACNMTFKEGETLRASPAIAVASRGEWGGIAFDLRGKLTWLTDKVHGKMQLSWSNRSNWTHRNFQAHVGLLFWSIGILNVRLSEYFALLRFISRTSQKLADLPHLWDTPIDIWDTAKADLASWTTLCLNNEPTEIRPPPAQADWIVTTDASRHGWGYCAVNISTGQIQQYGARWSFAFRRAHYRTGELRRSTFTEPHGLYNSLCHLLRVTGGRQHVIVGTDNIATMWAFERGYSVQSFSMNNCIARLNSIFNPDPTNPLFTFEFRYIPGVRNKYADAMSRGTSTSATSREIAQDLRQWAGLGALHEYERQATPEA